MKFSIKARADRRASITAALIGSGIGLSLGGAYMAGGMAGAASDHARAERLAEAAAGGYSETVLQREAGAMDPGALRVARRHDPLTTTDAAARDRQSADLSARLNAAPVAAQPLKQRAAFVPPATPFQPSGALSASRELECLTQAVYFEARGETPAGQAAVAQVVLNRVRHRAFPNSVCSVVYQGAARARGCQFSFACDGSMRRGREAGAWLRAQRVAAKALSGAVMASVGDSTHFHTTNVAPSWGPRMLRTAQVGMHVFYRFGRNAGRSYAEGRKAPEPEAELTYASFTSAPGIPAPTEIATELRLSSAVTVEPTTGAPAAGQGEAPAEPAAGKVTPTSAPTAPKPLTSTPS